MRWIRGVLAALVALTGRPGLTLAGGRTAAKEFLLSAGELDDIQDLTAPSHLAGAGDHPGPRGPPEASLLARVGDLNKVDVSKTDDQGKARKLTKNDDLTKLRELLKLGDLTNVGDLFKSTEENMVGDKSKSVDPTKTTDPTEAKDLYKTTDPSEFSNITKTDHSSSSSNLAEVGDLKVEVSELTSGRAGRPVGRSGRTLPEGLIQPGNPYETWSSYRGRLEGDRRQRFRRQRRAADTPHSRQKRFLTFPTGSILYVEPNVYLPIYRSRQLFQYIYAQYTMGWIIPQTLVVGRSAVDLARLYDSAEGTMNSAGAVLAAYFLELPIKLRWKLPVNTNTSIGLGLARDRGGVFEVASRALDKFGMDGRACLLRAVCEVAAYPMEHEGLFGEVMNIVLSASRGPDDDSRLDPYLRAEYQGRAQGDCHATYASCPVSLFNLI